MTSPLTSSLNDPTASMVVTEIALWLAEIGFATEWYPLADHLCPIPAYIIAKAYSVNDEFHRPAEYWQKQMQDKVMERVAANAGNYPE